MDYGSGMTFELPVGPDPTAIARDIASTFEDVHVAGAMGATFQRVLGAAGGDPSPDHAAFDTFVPHPVYAKQLWISILNPSQRTYDEQVRPLLAEAYERVARSARRKRAEGAGA